MHSLILGNKMMGNRDMSEEAKAVQEVAKTTREGLELTQRICQFLKKVFGNATEQIGEIAHDWAKFFRYKNLLLIQDKVETIHAKRHLEGKTVPISLRTAIPLIEKASLEDDESLQDMWAGLIANATDPNKRLDVKKIYIEILSSLEPLDVEVLRFLAKQGWNLHRIQFVDRTGGITVAILSEKLNTEEENLYISLQNLARLGCLIDERPQTRGNAVSGIHVTDPESIFRPSSLGFSLIEACE